jgi:hypothetical protein
MIFQGAGESQSVSQSVSQSGCLSVCLSVEIMIRQHPLETGSTQTTFNSTTKQMNVIFFIELDWLPH